MTAWKKLTERILSLTEGLQYRGTSAITLADLSKLTQGDPPDRPGLTGHPARPDGEGVKCDYKFNPSVWKGWTENRRQAIITAATDTKRDVHTQDVPQGGTVVKRSYGGRVFYQPGATRPHSNDRLGSTMDRYDVLMVADIGTQTNRKGIAVPSARLVRLAYSPAIGTFEERSARLQALLDGGPVPPVPRRPQPDVPQLPKDKAAEPHPSPQDLPRIGQNRKPARD